MVRSFSSSAFLGFSATFLGFVGSSGGKIAPFRLAFGYRRHLSGFFAVFNIGPCLALVEICWETLLVIWDFYVRSLALAS